MCAAIVTVTDADPDATSADNVQSNYILKTDST